MKKIGGLVFSFLLLPFALLHAYDEPKVASEIITDIRNFNGNLSSADTDVQKALDTLDNLAASGAPSTADYLVGTANGSLSAEIVVGTSPGGELGGTWGSPTLDDGVTVADWVFATSVQIPNGANPTTDAAGEIAIDSSTTSGGGIRFYTDAAYFLPAYQKNSFTITNVTSAGDFGAIVKMPQAVTIRAVNVVQVGATNVVGHLDECDSNGANCAGVDGATDITADGNNDADDGSLSNASIDAGDWIGWHTTSVSGTNTRVSVTFYYTVDQVN